MSHELDILIGRVQELERMQRHINQLEADNVELQTQGRNSYPSVIFAGVEVRLSGITQFHAVLAAARRSMEIESALASARLNVLASASQAQVGDGLDDPNDAFDAVEP